MVAVVAGKHQIDARTVTVKQLYTVRNVREQYRNGF
ncbi:Uncharacterised protein [Vibrio cholerae]|nr:Uncharacterised protein [Vibrio cholerae]CSB73816.1 Uncharacterised protein [Vibrio cholerae]